jgi:hypothetical protein
MFLFPTKLPRILLQFTLSCLTTQGLECSDQLQEVVAGVRPNLNSEEAQLFQGLIINPTTYLQRIVTNMRGPKEFTTASTLETPITSVSPSQIPVS